MGTFIGTAGNDTLNGTAESDVISGLGGNDWLYGHAGNDTLLGGDDGDYLTGGDGNDSLDGGAGMDFAIYEGNGVIADLAAGTANNGDRGTDTLTGIEGLAGSSGNDSLAGDNGANWLTSDFGNDTLLGRGGNDTLYGNEDNDTLSGGDGDDHLNGGDGNDSLEGGEGFDFALYDGDSVSADLATGQANNGALGTDTLSSIEGLAGTSGNDSLAGDVSQNWLTGGFGNDTLTGRGGNDSLLGNDGDDSLDGGDGDDLLEGGEGSDTLIAGTGHDTVDGGRGLDFEVLVGACADYTATSEMGGSDVQLQSALHGIDITVRNIERVQFADGVRSLGSLLYSDGRLTNVADIWTGTPTAEWVAVGGGDDLLDAGDGDDTVAGGPGDDTLFGGSGFDILYYSSSTGPVTVNLLEGSANGADGNDRISGFEGVMGTAGDDALTGDAGSNVLDGLGGNDTLIGGAGDDTLSGSSLDDPLSRLHVRTSYADATAAVSANLTTGVVTGGGGNDTLLRINEIVGSPLADTLVSDAALDFRHYYFAPGAGNDSITGNAGWDALRYDVVPVSGGVSVDLAAGTASDGQGGTDRFVGIEAVWGTPLPDTLRGSDRGDIIETLMGRAGDDTLDGRGGGDVASYAFASTAVGVSLGGPAAGAPGHAADGEGGNDLLTGIEGVVGSPFDDTLSGSDANGEETFEGVAGNDLIAGGGGPDVASYETATLEGANVDLRVGRALRDGWGGSDTLAGIEGVTGSRLFDDTIVGNDGANRLAGLGGNDSLSGHGGNDTLEGNEGSDRLIGGGGDDDLLGADGDDTLAPGLGRDTVDGGPGLDLVSYEDAVDGVRVNLSTGRATLNLETDFLTGVEGAIGSAKADTLEGSPAGDLLRAEDGNDRVDAAGGNDTVDGGPGNDTVDGGADDDSLHGGNGDDSFVGGVGNDTIVGSGGNDTLDGGDGRDVASYALAPAAVNASLGGAGTGSAGQAGDGDGGVDRLVGIEVLVGSAFNDTLNGTDGNAEEVFEGGAGNDVISGGGGPDVANYENAWYPVYVALGSGSTSSDGAGGMDALNGIEHVTGSRLFDDTIFGDAGANRLLGLGGNDSLSGEGGDDTLDGGEGYSWLLGGNGNDRLLGAGWLDGGDGNDSIIGADSATVLIGRAGDDELRGGSDNDILLPGSGSDSVDGGAGFDLLSYEDAHGVVVSLADGRATMGTETDQFNDVEGAVGSAGPDTLQGGAGDEFFQPLAGDDFIDGGAGNDTLSFAAADFTHVLVDLEAGRANRDGYGVGIFYVIYNKDTFANIENVVGSERFGDSLFGNAGANMLDGLGGNDLLDGRAGDDTMFSGLGDDTLVPGPGNDSVFGDAGFDIVSYDSLGAAVLVDLTAQRTTKASSLGVDTLDGVEGVVGSSLNDTIFGSADADRLLGGPGNDSVDGGGGADTVAGGLGNDSLTGGVGNDRLEPGGGDDTVDGGDGDDMAVLGSARSAWQVRVDGSDFVLTQTSGDRVRLRGVENVQFSDRTIPAPELPNPPGESISGTPGADTLTGGDGHDTLRGLAGDDRLSGGPGNDSLDGGVGNYDWLIGGDGNDTLDGGAASDQTWNVDIAVYQGGTPVSVDLRLGVAAQGTFTDTLIAIDAIFSGSGADSLRGADGLAAARGETLRGGGGNDTIDGGSGVDTAEFVRTHDEYALAKVNSNTWTVRDIVSSNGDEGIDTLINTERIVFADRMLAFGARAEELARVSFVLWTPGILASTALYARGFSFYDNGYDYQTLCTVALQFHAEQGQAYAQKLKVNTHTEKSIDEIFAIMNNAGGGEPGRIAALTAMTADPAIDNAIVASGIRTFGIVADLSVPDFGPLFGLLPDG